MANSDSPDKDKGQKKIGDNLPPDIGEGGEPLKGKEDDAGGSPDKGQDLEGLDPKVKEFMTKKGFTSLDQIVEAAENSEKKITDLSREARLNRLTPPAFAFPQGRTEPAPAVEEEINIPVPADVYATISKQEDAEKFFKDRDKQIIDAVEKKMTGKYQAAEGAKAKQKIYNKWAEDPEKFEQLRPIAAKVANENPGVDDLDWIFRKAEEVAKGEDDRYIGEVRKRLGIPESVTKEQIGSVFARANVSPHISSGGGGGQEHLTEAEKKKGEEEAGKLWDEIKGADKLRA